MTSEQFIDVNGIRTRFFEAGSGEPMLLLHGGNFGEQDNVDCANNWDLNWPVFAKSFHVYAIDRLGQGYTDNPKPGQYTIENIVAHIRGFIEVVGLRDVHLVGHSRGGYMATRVTMEDQSRIASLTIVDSSTTSPRVNTFRERLRANARSDKRSRESLAWIIEQFSYSPVHITKEWMDVREAIAKTPKNDEAATHVAKIYDSEFLPGLQRHKDDTLAWIQAGNLRVPTLIVWGRNDPSAVLDGGLDLFNLISEASSEVQMHIFNQAGHYCYREHPVAFADVVTAFIHSSSKVGI